MIFRTFSGAYLCAVLQTEGLAFATRVMMKSEHHTVTAVGIQHSRHVLLEGSFVSQSTPLKSFRPLDQHW
jgi:hypothetical protein